MDPSLTESLMVQLQGHYGSLEEMAKQEKKESSLRIAKRTFPKLTEEVIFDILSKYEFDIDNGQCTTDLYAENSKVMEKINAELQQKRRREELARLEQKKKQEAEAQQKLKEIYKFVTENEIKELFQKFQGNIDRTTNTVRELEEKRKHEAELKKAADEAQKKALLEKAKKEAEERKAAEALEQKKREEEQFKIAFQTLRVDVSFQNLSDDEILNVMKSNNNKIHESVKELALLAKEKTRIYLNRFCKQNDTTISANQNEIEETLNLFTDYREASEYLEKIVAKRLAAQELELKKAQQINTTKISAAEKVQQDKELSRKIAEEAQNKLESKVKNITNTVEKKIDQLPETTNNAINNCLAQSIMNIVSPSAGITIEAPKTEVVVVNPEKSLPSPVTDSQSPLLNSIEKVLSTDPSVLNITEEKVEAGQEFTVNLKTPEGCKITSYDWIAIYKDGETNFSNYVTYSYNPQPKHFTSFKLIAPTEFGSYYIRYFFNKTYECLARSNVFHVGPIFDIDVEIASHEERKVKININQTFGNDYPSAWIGLYESSVTDYNKYETTAYLTGKDTTLDFVLPKAGEWRADLFTFRNLITSYVPVVTKTFRLNGNDSIELSVDAGKNEIYVKCILETLNPKKDGVWVGIYLVDEKNPRKTRRSSYVTLSTETLVFKKPVHRGNYIAKLYCHGSYTDLICNSNSLYVDGIDF